jgi:glutathione S-transferase
VLQDGSLTLWESLAINLYLARKHDKGLWPKTVEDEGRAFQWSFWTVTELEEPVLTAVTHRWSLPSEQRDPKKAEDAAERFKTPLRVLDGVLAGRQHLLGDGFTVADLNVASVMSSAPLAGLDLSSAPNARGWLARCTERPAFARVLQKI